MNYLNLKTTDPAFNLAVEEYVFDYLPKDRMYVMLWQNDNAIIIGKNRATPILEGLKESGFDPANIHRVDSLDDSTKLLHSIVQPGDTVLYENDLPDHYQEA